MSQTFDDRLEEWLKWWNHNQQLVPPMDLKKRLDFHDKALHGAFELLAIARYDLERLEGARRKLLLPRGVEVRGDVRKFG